MHSIQLRHLIAIARTCILIGMVGFASLAGAADTPKTEGAEQPPAAEKLAQEQPAVPPIPEAEKVDLDKPVLSEPVPTPATLPAAIAEQPTTAEDTAQPIEESIAEPAVTSTPTDVSEPKRSLILLGKEVKPGITTRLSWSTEQSFEGIATPTPVLVAHGSQPGPILCITAAIHGDELNGIEIVRRVLYDLNPETLSGTVIGVPIVSLQGFHRSSRYLTDRRDLNRYFPGNPDGSAASRIAYSFFTQVIQHCDALVDLHTGSFFRTNLPQLRADLSKPDVVELTHGFGATVVLHSEGANGTLRRAAVNAGIPAITLEAGGPSQLQESAVSHGVKGIQTLLNKMGMHKKTSFWGDPEPVYYESVWVRANQGGILFSGVALGQRVKQDSVLGTITNPITNVKTDLVSPHRGRVLGMAINQVVQPGFAAFRIGIQKEEEEIVVTKEPNVSSLDAAVPGSKSTPPNKVNINAGTEPRLIFDK